MQPFPYARPESLSEAVELLGQHGPEARILAGGTDLLVRLRANLIPAAVVVDVKRIPELRAAIELQGRSLVVGAGTVMTDLAASTLVRANVPALAEAASVVGSVQIRNRATLVGNVCNASPAADTVPVLAVLGASVVLLGPSGGRAARVADFIQGNRRIELQRGELAVAVEIPLPERPCGTAFARITRRLGVDLASVSVACRVDEDGSTSFAFGAVAPRPLVVHDERRVLADAGASPAARAEALDALVRQARPISDVRASREYRLAMLRVLARRSLAVAVGRLRGGGRA